MLLHKTKSAKRCLSFSTESFRLSQTYQSRHKRVTHQLESRMREIRQSGSEGGVAGNGHPYPYTVTSWAGRCAVGPVSHRPFLGCRARCVGNVGRVPRPGVRALPSKMGWPERLEPYQGGGDGPRDSSPTREVGMARETRALSRKSEDYVRGLLEDPPTTSGWPKTNCQCRIKNH